MSVYSEDIMSMLNKRLIPKMVVVSDKIAKLEPYSYNGAQLASAKRQFNYYSMLYDYLYEYVKGNEEMDNEMLVNVVRLLEAPTHEHDFNYSYIEPPAPPVIRFGYKLFINGSEYYPGFIITPGQYVTFEVEYNTTKTIVGQKYLTIAYGAVTQTSNSFFVGLQNIYFPWSMDGAQITIESQAYEDSTALDSGAIWVIPIGDGNTTSLKDYDGNRYTTITVGNQEWTVEPLKVTHYLNGDPIENITTDVEWANNTTGAYAWVNNDINNMWPYGALYNWYVQKKNIVTPGNKANFGALYNWYAVSRVINSNKDNYGALYNWYAANDARLIANIGWHVPSFNDIVVLRDYVERSFHAYNGSLKLMESGLTYWDVDAGTNDYGMNIRGSGTRSETNGAFGSIRHSSWFWTSETTPTIWEFTSGSDSFIFTDRINKKSQGNPIRLLKDSTTLTHGQTGTYVGNDGTVYDTICIGTQEWMSENLCETRFRLAIVPCCAAFHPHFDVEPTQNSMFLTVGNLIVDNHTLGDYSIEWRVGSPTGTLVFTSGHTANVAEVQAQHPLVNEIVYAGTLYPVIKYIYIDGIKYSPYYDSPTTVYSPDLFSCLDPVVITAIECSTVLGGDSLYPYSLSYTNGVDLATNKSRMLRYNICGPGMKYLAVEFNAFQVSDQIKLYYCTLANPDGVLIENWIHGNRTATGSSLTQNLYPANYPTNPRVALYGITGTSPLCFIANISSFVYTPGDCIKIDITGGVYETTNPNTNWTLKLKSLDSVPNEFVSDKDIYKINSVPTISYLGSPSCRYEISYNTVDYLATTPNRNTVGVPTLFKYLWFWTYQTVNATSVNFNNPCKLGVPWNTQGISQGLYNNTGWGTKSNLDPGEQINAQKIGDDFIFSFSSNTDYQKMKSDITTLKASAAYTTWLTYPNTDSRYYGYILMTYTVAENVGDNTGTQYQFLFWPGDTIVFDDINKSITITCQVPVNNYPAQPECNTVGTTVASYITAMTNTKNLVNFSNHTHIRYNGWFYLQAPNGLVNANAATEFFFAWSIEDCFVSNLGLDLTALGFMKGKINANLWNLFRHYDKVTFKDVSDHDHRLANWKLERRTYLRTDNPADNAYETVYETP